MYRNATSLADVRAQPDQSPALRFTFATGSADNIKKWKYPNGDFMLNMDAHKSVINTMAANQEGVMVTGGAYPALLCAAALRASVADGMRRCVLSSRRW